MIHGTVAHLGSSVHGILQARILECGLSWPPPGDLPDPGIKLASPVVSCIGREFFTTLPPGRANSNHFFIVEGCFQHVIIQAVLNIFYIKSYVLVLLFIFVCFPNIGIAVKMLVQLKF